MAEKQKDIETFLQEHKDVFLENWRRKVELDLNTNKSPDQQHQLNQAEFTQLFEAYMNFMLDNEQSSTNAFIVDLIKRKIQDGFLLSTLELINASFMETARELFRSVYPDSFNTRMEYLERLSQMILNSEVTMAQYYENYLKDLNAKLRENAELLKQHNTSLVEFIDIATHQLQSPLWSILGFVSKLQRTYYEMLDEQGRHCLNRITANVSDMHQLIEDVTGMLVLSQDKLVKKKLFLSDLIAQAVTRIHNELSQDFSCVVENEGNLQILGDPYHLKKLFFELLKNAAQYKREDKAAVAYISWEYAGEFHLFIEDEGIGIDERYAELVLKPMERLKELDVPGSGMGLTFADRIVNRHGGSIAIKSAVKHPGACIHICLPLDIIYKM